MLGDYIPPVPRPACVRCERTFTTRELNARAAELKGHPRFPVRCLRCGKWNEVHWKPTNTPTPDTPPNTPATA